jgi:tRNA (cytidine/uridine-2'-O-)-methyltransferase
MKHTHERRHTLPLTWPVPPLNIALVEPEIPPNTGNIARLCAATGSRLHLVEPLGFQLTNAHVRRAGLDYWDSVDLTRHASLDAFKSDQNRNRCFYFSTRAIRSYTEVTYQPGDTLIFGSESKGLPDALLDENKTQTLGIPILTAHVRSLNLANAVAIVLYEALRQISSQTRLAQSPEKCMPDPGTHPSRGASAIRCGLKA